MPPYPFNMVLIDDQKDITNLIQARVRHLYPDFFRLLPLTIPTKRLSTLNDMTSI